MTIKLEVTKREKGAARTEGSVPGIVYGPKQEPISLSIDTLTFEKTLQQAGESTIITLTGLGEDIEVLVHDVAFNARRGGVEHVDFYAIERGKKLTTNVAIEYIGEAPVEKSGATVNRVLHDVEVTCRPSDLPSHIEVDLANMVDEESVIRVRDLVVGPDVEIENNDDDVVANVAAAREEEPEETETAEVDMDAVEVEGEKPEEESEEKTE